MIIGFSGMPRMGKSLLMSLYLKRLQAQTGLPLWANYPLEGSFQFARFDQIAEQKDIIIGWDEIHSSMDSRGFKDASSRIYTNWLTIISHFRTSLYYSSQYLHLVDRRLRDLTDYMYFVSGGLTSSTIRATIVYWPEGKIVGRLTVPNKEKYYSLYDSFAIIKPTLMPIKKND